MKAYFDSSALVKRYVDEKGSDAVESICSQAKAAGICTVTVPEIISALCRLRRERKLTATQYLSAKSAAARDVEDMTVCQITSDITRMVIEVLEGSPLRASDAIHIACARAWGADVFISADKRQMYAARKFGLKASGA